MKVRLAPDNVEGSVTSPRKLGRANDGTDRLRGIDLYHRWASITDEWRRGNHSGAGE